MKRHNPCLIITSSRVIPVCWLQSPMSHRGLLFELHLMAIMSSPGPVWNSVRGRFPSLLLKRGTGCRQNSSWCVSRQLSSAAWKHSSSGLPTVASSSDRTNLDNLQSWRQLRSSTSSQLDVHPLRLVTVGDRSFASAGPRLWSSLPDDITSAPSLPVFRKKLKTHLFRQSYPDNIM